MSEIFLKSSNLSLGYSNQIVIKGLDIQLSFINDYQIIGKNGAGKTTLMNFIALNFDGSYFESKVNRSQISINQISSTSTLIQELTLSENIDYYTSETSLASEEKLNIVFKYLPEDYLNEKIKSHLVMLLFSLFVAGSFVFGKIYAELIEPELLTFYRFLLGMTRITRGRHEHFRPGDVPRLCITSDVPSLRHVHL